MNVSFLVHSLAIRTCTSVFWRHFGNRGACFASSCAPNLRHRRYCYPWLELRARSIPNNAISFPTIIPHTEQGSHRKSCDDALYPPMFVSTSAHAGRLSRLRITARLIVSIPTLPPLINFLASLFCVSVTMRPTLLFPLKVA